MNKQWSVRRRTSLALVLSFLSVVPFLLIFYIRLAPAEDASLTVEAVRLAKRDFTAYLALWLVFATALLWWVRQSVVRPARQLARVMLRIAEGDFAAEIPLAAGGETLELSRLVRRAVDRFEERERAQSARIVELRDLVRRLLEQLEAPVFVVGCKYTIDFANDAALAVLGEKRDGVVGSLLGGIPGAETMISLVDEVMREGESHADRELVLGGTRRVPYLAHCALVRDARGNPARVIVMLAATGSGWWRRLFGPAD